MNVMRQFIIVVLFILPLSAYAQEMEAYLDPVFHDTLSLINDGNLKAAEKSLAGLKGKYKHTADFHYLNGQLAILKISDASIVRAPFIARRMRKGWEKALDYDQNHELSNFALAMFYAAAPDLMGGDKDKAQQLLDRLIALNSEWQYPLKTNILLANEAEPAVRDAAFMEWINHQPNQVGPRLNWAYIVNDEGNYERAAQQLKIIDSLLQESPEDAQQYSARVSYQWGKLAAESGDHLEIGRDHLLQLLTEETMPDGLSAGFVHARLAMVYEHLGAKNEAVKHRQEAAPYALKDTNLDKLLKGES